MLSPNVEPIVLEHQTVRAAFAAEPSDAEADDLAERLAAAERALGSAKLRTAEDRRAAASILVQIMEAGTDADGRALRIAQALRDSLPR